MLSTRELLDTWWELRKSLSTSRVAPLFAGVNEGSVGNAIHAAYVRHMLRNAADQADIDKRVGPSSLKATHEARTAERSSLYELDPVLHATRIGHDTREAPTTSCASTL